MSEEIILVCALADSPMTVPGSIYTRTCSHCRRAVMIAPSGQSVLAAHPQASIVCDHCFKPDPDDAFGLAGTTQEIRNEVRNARPNLHRTRN